VESRSKESAFTCRIDQRSGDPLWSNLFADAHVSLVCCIGGIYSIEGLWHPLKPCAHIIGPMSSARKTIPGSAFVQVGAYFSPSGASEFLDLPICDLADKVVGLETQWGAEAARLDDELNHPMDDSARVAILEAMLLRRLLCCRRRRRGFDSSGLAALATRLQGRLTVAKLADLAGISRQYLSRVFQDQIGVSPKLYCRLARFRALLAESLVVAADWADVAATGGYSDQSHMIAEFRKFSGVTPAQFIRAGTFHPFRWP
jgi:AraC-like DNA-binding protein